MARRPAKDGQRAAVIKHAFLLYHGQKITAVALARCLREFRQ